jgi:hypothetical protein
VGSLDGVEGPSWPVLSNSMGTTPLRMDDIARVLMLSDEDRGIDPQVGVGGLFGVSETRKRYNFFLYPKAFQISSAHKEKEDKEKYLPQPTEMKTVVHKTRLITWSAR